MRNLQLRIDAKAGAGDGEGTYRRVHGAQAKDAGKLPGFPRLSDDGW